MRTMIQESQTAQTLFEEGKYEKPLAAGEDPDFIPRKNGEAALDRIDEKLDQAVPKEGSGVMKGETNTVAPATPAKGWLSKIGSTLAWAFTPSPDAANIALAYPGIDQFPAYPSFGADPELSMALWGLNNRYPEYNDRYSERETMKDGEEVEDMVRRVSMSPIVFGDSSGMSRGIGARWESSRRFP